MESFYRAPGVWDGSPDRPGLARSLGDPPRWPQGVSCRAARLSPGARREVPPTVAVDGREASDRAARVWGERDRPRSAHPDTLDGWLCGNHPGTLQFREPGGRYGDGRVVRHHSAPGYRPVG